MKKENFERAKEIENAIKQILYNAPILGEQESAISSNSGIWLDSNKNKTTLIVGDFNAFPELQEMFKEEIERCYQVIYRKTRKYIDKLNKEFDSL